MLDEQLLGYGLQKAISRWYSGAVLAITELRPRTVITDQAIPELLRTVKDPTFVTINVTDFWRRLAPDRHFCILCFALSDKRVGDLPQQLRRTFSTGPFRTKRQRLGKIARVGIQRVQYYTVDSWAVRAVEWGSR